MRHRTGLRAVLLSVAVGLTLTGCGSSGQGQASPDDISASNVNVATPDMVAAKAASRVESCPAGQTKNGGLPAHTLPCLGGGRSVDLSTLKGPLIINVFQAGCVECIKEEPALAAFYRHHGKQYPVIGIDGLDTYPGVALKEAIARGVTYPLLADPGGDALTGPLSIRGFPTFFFLSADGRLTQAAGGRTSEADVLAMVQAQFEHRTSAGGNSADAVTLIVLGAVLTAGVGAVVVVRRRRADRSEHAS